ncbi:ATP-binding protein [Nodosilinea sp. PGN35]|uniref:ATP-binding protein n=1 Tax=Nodosilinea sp. PGN35 TaxID=3020489 RepID=UPI0023B27F0E|nr:ATP-binding protein [Nodosilinea sp. TSF1-S3]MDF0369727.1 ATP-binding protein [Nodosilinea sp. TSF1-S3]
MPSLGRSAHFLDQVSTTALRLYQAKSLDEILQNTVQDVQRLLGTDRVVIYQLDTTGLAQPVAIAARPDLPPLPDCSVDLTHCLQRWPDGTTLQRPRAIDDLADIDLTPCEQAMLLALGIEASLLMPIYLSPDWQQTTQWQDDATTAHEIWGFLVAQQSHPRHWNPLEKSFLRQLTQHLFHAIQQVQLRQFSNRLIESSVDGIIALDTSYRYQVWNSPMEELSGLPRRDVIGRVAWEVFPFLKETGEDKLIAIAMAGQSVVTENRAFVVPETGRRGFFEARYSPLMGSTGKVLGCLGQIRNITEQKQADHQLRATTSRLTTLIQNLQAGILVEDEHRRILLANQTFCHIFRLPLPPEALRGPDCEKLLLQAAALFRDPPAMIGGIRRILQRRQPVIGEEIELADGRILERDYIPIFIDDDYQGHLWQYRDITQRKQVQQQLEAAIQTAAGANRAKSNFVATMSHEIRTPLNAIVGLTDLLRLTQLDSEQQDFVDTIHNSGSMLLSLINDILDFSKIEADKLELEHRAFNLHRCVQDVVNLITPLAQEKGLVVRSHIAADVPERVVGDVTRLRQVLLNLVNNGVKFTHVGGVTVEVTLKQLFAPLAHTAELHFAVKDTGIGIPAENRDALFQAFSQLDASVARRYGGSGLGLAICKNLVEAMGGQIGVDTQLNVGTTFYFTIQVPVIPEGVPRGLEQPGGSAVAAHLLTAEEGSPRLAPHLPLKILVVDDLAVNQKVALKMLQWLGYEPDCAASGRAALDLVQRQTYDLVLMDIQMPDMDGYRTTEALRQLPQVTSEQPWIVAMTAHSNLDVKQRCQQVGLNDFLTKPITLASLVDCLMRYGQTQKPQAPVAPSPGLQPDDAASQPLLDREMINAIRDLGGDDADQLLSELVDNYREDATRCLGQLRQAILDRNGDQIRHQAHAIRSMSLNLGAQSLATFCQDLELHHSGMALADQHNALSRIEQTFAEVTAALQALTAAQSYA